MPTLPKYSKIARLAHVSSMTVSNVLRGRPGVSEAKREQVFRILRGLGVDIDALGKAVNGKPVGGRKRRSKSFLLVEAGLSAGMLDAPVYMELIRGIEEQCAAAGRSLQVACTSDAEELADAAGAFHGEGVILFGPAADAALFRAGDAGLAMVRVMGGSDPGERVDRVTYDNDAVGQLAAGWLIGRQCKRPAFIGGKIAGRGASFQAHCAQAGVDAVMITGEGLYNAGGEHQTINHAVLGDCLQKAVEAVADGFFVYSDQLAVALYGQMHRQDMRPMVDFPVVSCNREHSFLSLLDPPPATVDILVREIGRRAVDRLVTRIKHPEAHIETHLLLPVLVPPVVSPPEAAEH